MSQEWTVLLPFQLLHTSATSRRFLERVWNGRLLKGIDCVDQGRTWAIDWEVCFNAFCGVSNFLYLLFMHFCFCYFLMEVLSRPFQQGLGFAMQPRLPMNSGSTAFGLAGWQGGLQLTQGVNSFLKTRETPANWPGRSLTILRIIVCFQALFLLIAVCLWKIKFNSCPLSTSRALQINVFYKDARCRQQFFFSVSKVWVTTPQL